MQKLKTMCQKFVREEEGATAVEYAVMLVLIIVVCIAVVTVLGQKVNNTFKNVADSINK